MSREDDLPNSAQLAAWRAADELGLPMFPPDYAADLRGTLDYPPKGAALRPGSGRE